MKSEDLLDAIGEAKDEYVQDVRNGKGAQKRPWKKWGAAIAACLVLALGLNAVLENLGANTGTGGDVDLNYMHYMGPVLPLTVLGDPDGITAARNVDYNFSGYYTHQEHYTDETGEPVYYDRYDNTAFVTDSYVLTNHSGEDKTVTLQYPFAGNLQEWKYYPTVSVNGKPVTVVMHPGPYSGGFTGVTGSDAVESLNLDPLENFEGYQALLSDGAYKDSAFDPFPVLDQTVYVYKLHDYIYSKTTEKVNPTLSFSFYIDYDKTTVFSYGMNGATWDPESGYCARRTGGIEYRPNVDPEFQHPDPSYVILMGEDLENYTLQGYKNGACNPGEELNDLGCTVTRYETTLGEIMASLIPDYQARRFAQVEENPADNIPGGLPTLEELHLGLSAELLCTYGVIGNTPVERYELGELESIFSEALSNSRVIYLTFAVTVPAGGTVAVEAAQVKDASVDFIGNDKDKDGFDMATKLGSNLTFTEQTASICRFEEIEIVAQNFGFDLENGVTKVTLDTTQEHYWIQVRKIHRDG